MLIRLLKPGTNAREKHTGFEGVITALMVETGNRTTYRLEGPSKDGSRGAVKWFEADRIEYNEPANATTSAEDVSKESAERATPATLAEFLARGLANALTRTACSCDDCARARTRQQTH